MARGDFLALAWRPDEVEATRAARAVSSRLEGSRDWACRHREPGLVVWTGGPAPLPARPLAEGGVLIGRALSAPGAREPRAGDPRQDDDPMAWARALSGRLWGGYVALRRIPRGVGAYRDPTGALACLGWSLAEAVWLLASDLGAVPSGLRPPRLALNWDRIARFLAIPSAATTPPLFDGLEAVGPGGLGVFGRGPKDERLVWRPAEVAARATLEPRAAALELVRRVDHCTAALCGGHDRLLVEVSGGLDSAIVAAALAEAGLAPRVAQWLNRRGGRAESDEEGYARAVCARIGAELTSFPKPRIPLAAGDLAETAGGVRPSITAADVGSDRDTAARLTETGATAVLSGQGGDAVFFQMATPLIVADAWRRDGASVLRGPLLADVARRSRRSVWGVLAALIAERRGRTPPRMAPSPLVTAEVAALAVGAVHAWVADAREADVLPAKRLQIEAIANCQIYNDESRRTAAGEQLFPLLAQPVVELCLALPAPRLAAGVVDRGFARAAFAHRLPDVVRTRRSKGNMSAFFARLVAESLPTLRPYLLDGCLAEARVLDRPTLDRLLDAGSLIQVSHATEILWAAAAEAWVRHWQARVPDSAVAPRWRPPG